VRAPIPEFSCPKGHAPALFLLACNLVCSQSPLVGASRSRISLDAAAVFAELCGASARWVVVSVQGIKPGGKKRLGAGEALALLFSAS